MNIETKKQPKIKKIKDTDRLIARMILGVGLSLSIASAVACGIIHPKLSDAQDKHLEALNNKNSYLDTYEQTDEFKTIYNADVNTLNNRLIAREIDGNTYENELANLNANEYTEKVLVENGNAQTKAEFDEVNQKYLEATENLDKLSNPAVFSATGTFLLPFATSVIYYSANLVSKERHYKHSNLGNTSGIISDRTMNHSSIFKDMPTYQPINAEETKRRVEIVHDEKLGVLRAVENQPNTTIPNRPRSVDACIIKTEEENENVL